MDLHSNHNSKTDVAVSHMCCSHNCYQEPAYRQACFLIDNQNCCVNHHSTHNSKTVEYGLVNYMDIGHSQNSKHLRKTVHRQTCFRFDT